MVGFFIVILVSQGANTDENSFKASAIRDARILEDGSQQGGNGLPHIPPQRSLMNGIFQRVLFET